MKKILMLLAVFGLVINVANANWFTPSETTKQKAVEKTEGIANAQTMGVTKAVESQAPNVSLNVSGTNNSTTVTIPANKSNTSAQGGGAQNAQSFENVDSHFKETIPFGVKLIFLALGIGGLAAVLIWLIRYAKTQSAAFTALYTTVDQWAAHKIDAHRAAAAASTDHATIAQNSIAAADLEKLRGKVNSI